MRSDEVRQHSLHPSIAGSYPSSQERDIVLRYLRCQNTLHTEIQRTFSIPIVRFTEQMHNNVHHELFIFRDDLKMTTFFLPGTVYTNICT